MFKYFSITTFIFLASINLHAGQSLQVTKTVEVNASAEEVWKYVSDFCAIEDWHPAVANCEISDTEEGKFRFLTLQDGGKIKERHGGKNPTGYMYSITESPLPVQAYNALFEVDPKGENAMITWSATFLAKDKPDNEAKKVIEGIFDAGLNAIKSKMEKQ